MNTQDYVNAARDLREFNAIFEAERGVWLIEKMKQVWDDGVNYFLIPPGRYLIREPLPVAPGSTVEGRNEVVLVTPALNYFSVYPTKANKTK